MLRSLFDVLRLSPSSLKPEINFRRNMEIIIIKSFSWLILSSPINIAYVLKKVLSTISVKDSLGDEFILSVSFGKKKKNSWFIS